MKKQIDLEEIIKNESNPHMWFWINEADYRKEFIKDMMISFGQQLLELAAENANTKEDRQFWSGQPWDDGPLPIIIDRQSILDTIKQIK